MYIELQADDVERAARFYHDLFGWDLDEAGESSPTKHWRFRADGLSGGILKRSAPAPEPDQSTNAFVCSFKVDDFDQAVDRITGLGGQVALAKFAVPGQCWTGYFLDTEGNTFGVYESDDFAR